MYNVQINHGITEDMFCYGFVSRDCTLISTSTTGQNKIHVNIHLHFFTPSFKFACVNMFVIISLMYVCMYVMAMARNHIEKVYFLVKVRPFVYLSVCVFCEKQNKELSKSAFRFFLLQLLQ